MGLVLMLWALSILGYKGQATYRQQRLLERDLLALPDGLPIGAEDTRELAARVQSLPPREQEYLLPRALLTAIERFAATRHVQDVLGTCAARRGNGWNRSSRPSAISPGPFPRWGS